MTEPQIAERRYIAREANLPAVMQGPDTRPPRPLHRVFLYLLRGVVVAWQNQVWRADVMQGLWPNSVRLKYLFRNRSNNGDNAVPLHVKGFPLKFDASFSVKYGY